MSKEKVRGEYCNFKNMWGTDPVLSGEGWIRVKPTPIRNPPFSTAKW